MNSDDDQLIDQYFSNELDETGRIHFQQKLETDTDFAAAFELRLEMETFLERHPQREMLKDKLKTLGKDFKEEKTTKIISITQKRKQWLWVAGIAAAIALIAIIIWPFLFPSSLYEQYNQHRPLALQERSTSANLQAETAFNDKNFDLAYLALTEYLNDQPNDVRAQLALGISALELDRIPEAKRIFETIREGESAFSQSASWYLALTHIKQNELEEARAYLEQIPSGSFWYTKAQALLKKLD